MSRREKFKEKLFDPNQHGNIKYDELTKFLNSITALNKRPKVGGSHSTYIYKNQLINIQCGKNGEAKRYQVQQIVEILQMMEASGDTV